MSPRDDTTTATNTAAEVPQNVVGVNALQFVGTAPTKAVPSVSSNKVQDCEGGFKLENWGVRHFKQYESFKTEFPCESIALHFKRFLVIFY